MNFSLSTVINTTLVSSIFICIAISLIRIGITRKQMKLYTIFFLCVAIVLRMFIPLEFSFTHSIYIKNLWIGLHSILNNSYVHFFHMNIEFKYILLILWLIGFLCKLTYTLDKRKKSMDLIYRLPKATDACAVRTLENCNAQFRHFVPVRLLTESHISSPFIAGIRFPVIVIPDIHLEEKEWEYIFAHELAHYYKGHLLFQFLMEILASLYFWNPLLLFLNKQLPKLYEFSADESVCSSLNSLQKIEYSHCMLKILHWQIDHPASRIFGISFTSSDLGRRIRRAIDTRQTPKAARLNYVLLIGTVLLFILSYTIILEPEYSPSGNSFTMDASNSYYLPNEDGTYDVIYNNEYLMTTDWIFDEQIPIKEDSAL